MTAAPATVHATALVLGVHGVLLRGHSRSGKSTLALALIGGWRRAGRFAALVADDRVVLEAAGGRLVARAPEALAGLAELAGRGILAVDHEPSAVIRLVVDLLPSEALARMPEEAALRTTLGGVEIPRQAAPARSILPAMVLVEAALAAACHATAPGGLP
jgi:HPr kinase/phosphorylase